MKKAERIRSRRYRMLALSQRVSGEALPSASHHHAIYQPAFPAQVVNARSQSKAPV
jgi:hypothetical protein